MAKGQFFASLCALVFMVNLARVVYAPLVEPLRNAFGVGPATIGLVVTLAWVGSALPRIPTGYLLTRFPRHKVVIATGFLLTGAATFATMANSIQTIAIAALFMGLASGAYFVSALPLVSELYPSRIGRAIGVHGATSQIAAVIAAPIVTVALLLGSWRVVFGAIAVAALITTLVLAMVARETTMPAASGIDRNFVGAITNNWQLLGFGIILMGSTGFLWQGLFNFYPTYMEVERGLSPSVSRNLLTIIFLAGVPAFWISGRLVDTFEKIPYVVAVMVGFIGGVAALTLVNHLIAIVVLTFVIGYIIHSIFPAMDSYVLSNLPDGNRASAYAIYSGGMMAVQATGSFAVGSLVELGWSFDTVFVGLAGVVLVVATVAIGLYQLGLAPGSE